MSERSEKSFDERWDLPEKFRITPEKTLMMQKLIEAADAQQKELLAAMSFESAPPQTRERARAVQICEKYESLDSANLPSAQMSEWAAAYAVLGRFDRAAAIAPTAAEKADYLDIWAAVWRDNNEGCPHPHTHRFAEKDVYSVQMNAEAVLMRCNVCLLRNVVPMPDYLRNDRSKRAEYRARFAGTNPQALSK